MQQKFEKDSEIYKMFGEFFDFLKVMKSFMENYNDSENYTLIIEMIKACLEIKNFEQSEIFNVMKHFYLLSQDIWIVENVDSYWTDATEKTMFFADKYKDSPNYEFAKSLGLMLLEQKEIEWKRKYGGVNDV